MQSNEKDIGIIRQCADAFREQPDIKYIVKGMIEEGTATCVWGDSGAGKTYFMLTLGICIAAGIPFMDRDTTQMTVLYIDEEMGWRTFERRVRQVCNGLGLKEENLKKLPFYYTCSNSYNFKMPADVNNALEKAKKLGAKLAFIDALVDVMEGDENSVKDIRPIFNNLKTFLANEIGYFINHHSIKNGNDYRGSSSIKGFVDNLINIDAQKSTNNFTVKFDKTRDGRFADIDALKVYEKDSFSIEVLDNTSPTEVIILRVLENIDEASTIELIEIGKQEGVKNIKAGIYSLLNKGKIECSNPNAPNKVGKKYRLVRKITIAEQLKAYLGNLELEDD